MEMSHLEKGGLSGVCQINAGPARVTKGLTLGRLCKSGKEASLEEARPELGEPNNKALKNNYPLTE